MPDSIPPDEFIQIFHRLCHYVRLGRVRNRGEIRDRMRRILTLMKRGYQTAKRGSTVKKFRSKYVQLRTLYRVRIDRRIWEEAQENPGSIFDLTLDYGYNNAQRIALASSRERMGELRRLRRTKPRRRRR